MIDRIAPTVRPQRSIAGYQRWRDLLFMHWPVPMETLRPLIPAGLELDTFEDVAYVGIVPFRMLGVRPWWWPPNAAFRFLETNVRTYVCYRDQPGVYFFSLEAGSRLAVWGARQFWGLPYYHADMRMTCDGEGIHYETRRRKSGAQLAVRYRLGELLRPLQPHSLEYFLLERYLLFVERRSRLYVGQVHHTPYPAQSVEILESRDDLAEAAGLGRLQGLPALAHYAAGVDVEVFGLRPIEAMLASRGL
jgi:uncharacterized protein YqjF (DUF2071 family)